MNIKPEIRLHDRQWFVGMKLEMSLIGNRTFQLFRQFMPRRKEIQNQIGLSVYDIRIYPIGYFDLFDRTRQFTKMVMVRVTDHVDIPTGMEGYELAGGKYAVFEQPRDMGDPTIYEWIYREWIVTSDYELDELPHFDVISNVGSGEEKEEIWVPVRVE